MAKEKKEHVDFQRSYFDQNVHVFKNPIPDDVVARSREIVSSILQNNSVRILDVGTGIGAFLKYYNELGVPYANITGCDLSSQMLAEAKERFPEVHFWQGDVHELPADFGLFDLVVFNACFGNIFDQLGVMATVASHLNPGGRIAISHPMGNAFVQWLKDAEPDLVITLLPERQTLEHWAKSLLMQVVIFRDESEFYLALLEKTF